MKKYVVIPDIHGRKTWERIFFENKIEDVEKFVFLGDYVDSFTVSNADMIKNLQKIIRIKDDNPNKVVLLLGNHDVQYSEVPFSSNNPFLCSGYRTELHLHLFEIFKEYSEFFASAFQVQNYIFTHAGIQDYWFKNIFRGDVSQNIAEQLDNPIDRNQYNALHHVGHRRGGGHDVGGIYWCDKEELKKPLEGFNQIVGHTPVKHVVCLTNNNSKVWFTDCLEHNTYGQLDYLTLEI